MAHWSPHGFGVSADASSSLTHSLTSAGLISHVIHLGIFLVSVCLSPAVSFVAFFFFFVLFCSPADVYQMFTMCQPLFDSFYI